MAPKKSIRRQRNKPDSEYVSAACMDEVALFAQWRTDRQGLKSEDVHKRLAQYGKNELARTKRRSIVYQLGVRFLNPLVLVLLIIASLSAYLGDYLSASLVASMAGISVFLSFIQEYRAGKEAEKLSEMVRATATVYRSGKTKEVKLSEIAPGDIVDLFAGDMIPADLRLLSAKDLFINQSALTGEAFPIEKFAVTLDDASGYALTDLPNIAFMGSSVVSGSALGLVIRTGGRTQFGAIAESLTQNTETSFDRGIRELTWLMIRFMLTLVIVVFTINAFVRGNFFEALMFSLAVAVGLTPEMLPMVVALNLSKGAIAMARHKVVVKRLHSIQNFGAMDVFCTDKTGTLTLDKVVLERYCDIEGNQDEAVFRAAYMNSYFQTGLKGLLDRTILDHETLPTNDVHKVDEIPFDFERKIMSVIIAMNGKHRLIAKGAPEEIFKRCTHYEYLGEIKPIGSKNIERLEREYESLSQEGFRVLAVAYRDERTAQKVFTKDDEKNLILRGYIAFLDPPKPTAKETIEALRELGIQVKVLTGDNPLVTKKICEEVGLSVEGTLVTGDELEKCSGKKLLSLVEKATIFARLSPMQKEKVIRALHDSGHVVGFLGDGINDAPALKAADVGISVNNAVDIAKESADIILLQKSLAVLKDGVIEGRRTFGNILKYIRMGTSSNFGNMLSMTGASIFLPFLPMAPIQVLLNNFLYDLSQLAIPTDTVDEEYVRRPRPWDISSIRRFMVTFGPISSVFDFLTFGLLLWLGVSEKMFHTGWFIESFCTQALVIHIIRTEKIPFLQSRASTALTVTSLLFVGVAIFLAFSGFGAFFQFERLPLTIGVLIGILVIVYLFVVQAVKVWMMKRWGTGLE